MVHEPDVFHKPQIFGKYFRTFESSGPYTQALKCSIQEETAQEAAASLSMYVHIGREHFLLPLSRKWIGWPATRSSVGTEPCAWGPHQKGHLRDTIRHYHRTDTCVIRNPSWRMQP